MKDKLNFYINGKWVESKSKEKIEIINPANEELIGHVTAGTKDVFCTFPASKTMDMTLTTAGDILYASANNTPARLAKGSALQVLQMNSGATAPEWTAAGASAGFAIAMAVAL